jgi:hypothetical protein
MTNFILKPSLPGGFGWGCFYSFFLVAFLPFLTGSATVVLSSATGATASVAAGLVALTFGAAFAFLGFSSATGQPIHRF